MKARIFTNIVAEAHRVWLGNLFNMHLPAYNSGIDLSDEEVGIEIKSRLRKYSTHIAVHHYQISEFREENRTKELYWAFLLYDLTMNPKAIRTSALERFIRNRECWFLRWDFVDRLPVYSPKTGPYVYVNSKDFLDKEFKRVERKGAILYLPVGSDLEERLAS